MLRIQNAFYSISGREILKGATVHIPAGHRIGLVGANGSGKTTLLRLVMRQKELDHGSITVRSRSRINSVAQDPPGGSSTPFETVLAADVERSRLLSEADACSDAERIGEIHTRLVDIDAHVAPSRASAILAGLGFHENEQHKPLASFSGGWRMRVALGSDLFSEPDLLLLDEPTNHLDLESALWLQGHLKGYPHTFLVVSHDRHFLNTAVSHILHLEDGKLATYTGGYDAFEREWLERHEQSESRRAREEGERKRIIAFVERFKAKATKARQAQSRLKMLERMPPSAAPVARHRVCFDFPEPVPSSSPLIRLDRASVGYIPEKKVLFDLNLAIYAEDRIALLGPNGNGKTTLARLIEGTLKPRDGQVFRSSKIRVGYFAQDHLDRLDAKLTAYEQLHRHMPGASPNQVRSWLGRFGFSQEKSDVQIEHLSGGEKTRIALAVLCIDQPNLLLLDEPTNHLDIDARQALIRGLTDYKGAIVLISHDRNLVEATAEQLWLIEEGNAKMFFGDLEDYNARLLEAQRLRRRDGEIAKDADLTQRTPKRDVRREAAATRSKLSPLKKKVAQAEALLESLLSEKQALESELSNPATYTGPKEKAIALAARQRELNAHIGKTEETWLEAQTELETAIREEENLGE